MKKTFRFKMRRGSGWKFPAPSRPQLDINADKEQEALSGMVRGMTASAPEERLAKALDQAGFQYLFRYSVGAPRGLPGWKELDFAVYAGGLINPIEVDTAFTHRNKAASDQLHDAIVMNDFELNSMGTLAPFVRHADGDSELANMTNARMYVKRNLGNPMPQYTDLPQMSTPAPQTVPQISAKIGMTGPSPVKKKVSVKVKYNPKPSNVGVRSQNRKADRNK